MTAPKLSWSDLAGARVGVWGLGREGHASLRKLLALGVEPVLVDDQPSAATGPFPAAGGYSPPATAASPRCSGATWWSRRPACPGTGRKWPG